MKRLIFLFSFIGFSILSQAQTDADISPSQRFKLFPQAKLLLADSVHFFTKSDLKKNKPVMMIVFNPDCGHCQHETEALLKVIDKFKGIQIIMATMAPLYEMNQFVKDYKLDQYKNITVAKDVSYYLPTYYKIYNLPFLAFYDKKFNLISDFSGTMPMADVLKVFGR
ncbi:MAG: redoxin domain-containing protein [Chitinophagaceae bacterium]|nr:redoxin domain-containing protein [Chitinophagaceae bacterium]MCB0740492.1 redoxin domain-containing protein [Chitinophagaceae bacterium]HQV06665.1 redoxin domain-containing protein [Chitinophagaceae bacterium]